MNKRILAALLCLILFVTSLPCAAGAGEYSYPPVDAAIPPDDQLAIEMAFREWAAELLYCYYVGGYKSWGMGNNKTELFAEYYRLADLKREFDRDNQNNEHVIYNVVSGTEEDKKSLYTWVLLESLKEAVMINSDEIIAQYHATPEDERIYMMLDISTGELKKDTYVENAQERVDAIKDAAVKEAFLDAFMLGVDTFLQYQIAMSGASKGDLLQDCVSAIIDTVDAAAEAVLEGQKTNALITARNDVRNNLASDIASRLTEVNKKALGFLQNAYGDMSSFRYNEYRDLIETFIEVMDSTNPLMETQIATAATEEMKRIVANAEAEKILNGFDYELAETMDPEMIAAVAAINALGTALEEFIDILSEQLQDAVEGKKLSVRFRDKTGKTITADWSADAVIEAIGNVLSEYCGEVTSKIVDDYYAQYAAGTTVDINVLETVGTKLLAAFTSKDFLYELGSNVVMTLIPDFEGQLDDAVQGVLDVIMSDIFTADSDSEMAKNVLELFAKSAEGMANATMDSLTQERNKYLSQAAEYQKKVDKKVNRKVKRSKEYKRRVEENKALAEKYSTAAADIETRINELEEFAVPLVDVVTNVWDRAWETGTSIRAALDSTVASANGEGRVSLLAGRVYAAKQMSLPVMISCHEKMYETVFITEQGGFMARDAYDIVLDREKVALEDLVQMVSSIQNQFKYDIVGAKSYFDISLQFWEGEEYLGWWGKIEEDEIKYHNWFVTKFIKYMFDNYSNIYGENEILGVSMSEGLYDQIVFYQNYYFGDTTWDPAWEAYFQ